MDSHAKFESPTFVICFFNKISLDILARIYESCLSLCQHYVEIPNSAITSIVSSLMQLAPAPGNQIIVLLKFLQWILASF